MLLRWNAWTKLQKFAAVSYSGTVQQTEQQNSRYTIDYIGNTVAQRLFEKCSDDVKTIMLQAVAPHLAAMGVHKNGTWAAQKIIDSLNTQKQVKPLDK